MDDGSMTAKIGQQKSLRKNFLFNLVKTLTNILFPVITFSYTSRVLGVAGVGKFNFARNVLVYFNMIASLGISHYGLREAAKIRDDEERLSRFVQEMLLISLCSTLASYGLFLLCVASIPLLQDYLLLLLINSSTILLNGLGMEWLYGALEEYRYISVRSIAFQAAALVLMLLLVKRPGDLPVYAAINVLASSGSYVMNFFHCRKFITLRRHGKLELRRHLTPLLLLFMMNVSINLYTVLDSTMLGVFKGDEAVGLYTAGIKVNKIVISLITSLGVVLIPRLSYYVEFAEKHRFNALVDKAYHFTYILSVPACVGLTVLSEPLILLLSGTQFTAAGVTMRLLTPILLVIPFSVLTNNQIFITMRKEKLILISTCAGAAVNFTLNLLLIPRFGENGAAAATVLAETTVMLICFYNAGRYLPMRQIIKGYYKYWIAALPIAPIGFMVKSMIKSPVLICLFTVVLSAAAYFGLLYRLKETYVREAAMALMRKFPVWKG